MDNGQTQTPLLARHAALFKVMLLGFLVLLMLIPLEYVYSVIKERAHLSKSVTRELGESWGRSQTIAGPILLLPVEEPYVVKVKSPDYTEEKPLYLDETRWHRRNLYILPDAQQITADLTSQTRKRGIYEALLYTADAKARGSFRIPAAETLPLEDGARVQWPQAKLLVQLSDLRGSANAPKLLWGNEELLFDVRSNKLHSGLPGNLNWIQAPLPKLTPGSAAINYAFDLKLKGSSALGFVPLGRDSEFALTGDWPHPSFTGVQLPVSNEVRDDGFSAQWQISHLARGLPQVLRDDNGGAQTLVQQIHLNAVKTKLLNPVDFYRMSERSAKYGLLFIIVTFGTLFVFEAVGKRRLHVVQYLMVGAAVTLFFLLQVSLAEVIGFASAFGLAALACVALVTLYAAKITARWTRGLMLGGLLSGVYGYLFFTLQAEDQAMLMGSLLLLVLLAAAMYATRNFDWYALGERLMPPGQIPSPDPAMAGPSQESAVWGNTTSQADTPASKEPEK
ncbi:cell envelope integrity protein CreD [Denitrobaculum tricleocarpae]|uniref:Cell envelope integrity protein CreD n=1 Tax=Denitrobaculum tricleocarpae TaxID=2591009 RepID=A0A545TKE2_9PROT|nr:cell envelope integrity protein CreD [Denitrobaculum tricleocarpae]TQV77693.1 cell envelope integrity protein CreD [Denitrobaculum tricleocarpae]